MWPGGKEITLSQTSWRHFTSEAKKTVSGEEESQPWYRVVTPIASLAAMILSRPSRTSWSTKEKKPSSLEATSRSISSYK